MNAEQLIKLLSSSHSAFHAIGNAREMLLNAGYRELKEEETYELRPGEGYFVTRNQSSLIAFFVPTGKPSSIKMASVHSDSPTFKLKPNPAVRMGKLIKLDVEPYGGALYHPWMDRPLSLAGRVFVEEGGKVLCKVVDIDEDLCQICNLPIHFNREANKGVALNPAVDMLPILGEFEGDFDFHAFLAEKLGIESKDKLLSFDLYLYNRDLPRLVGANREFLSSPRLDDLSAAYAVLDGFIAAEESDALSLYCLFDNEEVGSLTRQGAAGTFLPDTLSRIQEALGLSQNEFLAAIAKGFALSVDNAHAVHPNHKELFDQTTNVALNGGIVLKSNANQTYTTDACSAAMVKAVAASANVPIQEFTNRADLRGGSTLGNLSNAEVSIRTADIGLAQLAMHSCNELCGAKDIETLSSFIKVFFEKTIDIIG